MSTIWQPPVFIRPPKNNQSCNWPKEDLKLIGMDNGEFTYTPPMAKFLVCYIARSQFQN